MPPTHNWIDDLPILPIEGAEHDSLLIYRGEINGISNLVCHAAGKVLGTCTTDSEGKIKWRYNEYIRAFETVEPEGSNWISQMISQSGYTEWTVGVAKILDSLSQEDIVYQLNHA